MENLSYFKNLIEIKKALSIKSTSHILSVCKGERSHAQNLRFAKLDINGNPVLMDKHKSAPKKIARKVICLNDERIFISAAEAGREYGLNSSSISSCAKGKKKSVKKNNVRYRFAELDENDKPILTATHEEGLDWKGKGGKIMRINDRKIFNSLAAFLRETGINRKRAKKYEEDQNTNLFGNEYIVL